MDLDCIELKARHFAKLVLSLFVLTVLTLFLVSESSVQRATGLAAHQTSSTVAPAKVEEGVVASQKNLQPGNALDLL